MSKFKVTHFPQVGDFMTFSVEVETEKEAFIVVETMAHQHLWLFKNRFIPDYSNAISVEKWNGDSQEWENFWDEEEYMEWDEYAEMKFAKTILDNGIKID